MQVLQQLAQQKDEQALQEAPARCSIAHAAKHTDFQGRELLADFYTMPSHWFSMSSIRMFLVLKEALKRRTRYCFSNSGVPPHQVRELMAKDNRESRSELYRTTFLVGMLQLTGFEITVLGRACSLQMLLIRHSENFVVWVGSSGGGGSGSHLLITSDFGGNNKWGPKLSLLTTMFFGVSF